MHEELDGQYFRSPDSMAHQVDSGEFSVEELVLAARYYIENLQELEPPSQDDYEDFEDWQSYLMELEDELDLSYELFFDGSDEFDFRVMTNAQLSIQAILEALASLWEEINESDSLCLELVSLSRRCMEAADRVLEEDGPYSRGLQPRAQDLREEAELIVIRSDNYFSVAHVAKRLQEIHTELTSLFEDGEVEDLEVDCDFDFEV